MSDKSSSSEVSVGLTSLLTLLFIGLKLTGYINWSWWWVLAPIWITVAIALIAMAVCLIIYLAIDK